MSYQRLITDVDPSGLRALVHSRLLHKVESGSGSVDLTESSLCSGIPLSGERYKRNDLYDLRISKLTVKALMLKASEGYNSHVCAKISMLYRTGFGLPQSKECHLIWEHLKEGNAPKINGKVFSYRDMVRVLKGHWRFIHEQYMDPEWLYFDSQNRFFSNLLNRTFPTFIQKQFLSKHKPKFALTKYEGMDCSLVYKTNLDGSAKLFAAYSKIKGKLLNVTVQALKSKNVLKVLPEGSIPKGFGAYFVLSGTFTIKKRDLNYLRKEWGEATCINMIKQCFDQDVYSLAEFKNVKLERTHPSVEFCRKYKSKYKAAQKFMRKNKGKSFSKAKALTFNKAQRLLDTYEDHQATIDSAKAEYDRLREYEIFDRIQFIVYDAFGYSENELKLVSTPYAKVFDFLSKLGFNMSVLISTQAKTVNKVCTEVVSSTKPGYLLEGAFFKLYENGNSKNSLNWVKLKL